MSSLDIVGLCGSLRRGSFNHMALRLAGESMPPSMRLEVLEWREVPIYDGDVEAQGLPAPVAALRERIRRADGVLIVSPEYNFSMPGGLKNTIDWFSRGADQPFAHKPVAIASASGGPMGGGRMQYDLRKTLLILQALVMIRPEVFIGQAQTKFDAATGQCTDEPTRKHITDQMAAFGRWIEGVGRMHGPQGR